MPSKKSKSGERAHYTAKDKQNNGSLKERLGADSQLPFGYCPLSLNPIDDPVATPSGHVYSREAMLEYLLNANREIKSQRRKFEQQQQAIEDKIASEKEQLEQDKLELFASKQSGVSDIVSRDKGSVPAPINSSNSSSDKSNNDYVASRKRLVDDTSKEVMLKELKEISPWIVQFTPSAKEKDIAEPLPRPSSPFSGQPLRAKDLVPIHLIREDSEASINQSGPVRFICAVSRKTITNQRTVALKNTGVVMLETVADSLAIPSMVCPVTGVPFKKSDVLTLVSAASGYAASGAVESKKYRPSIN